MINTMHTCRYKVCTFCAVCIKQMLQIQCGGLRSYLPLLEGLTYLYHLYAHVKSCTSLKTAAADDDK